MYFKMIGLLVGTLASTTLLVGGTQEEDLFNGNSNIRGTTFMSNVNRGFRGDNEINKAAAALRSAENSSARKEAGDKLKELLDADYDSRLAEYAEYLDELESQLKEMRSKLERRKAAKSDMIDLRIKVLEAEADDLGWPARVNRGSFPRSLPINKSTNKTSR